MTAASHQQDSPAWQEVVELLHAVSNVPAYDLEGLLEVLAHRLARLGDASKCTLLVGMKDSALPEDDPLGGWRVRQARVPHGTEEHQAALDALVRAELYTTDPHTIATTRGTGHVRASLRADCCTPEEWAGSLSERYFDSIGVRDHLVAARPVTDDTELYAVLMRFEARPFGPRDRDRLAMAMGYLEAPARRIAYSFGSPKGSLLSPRERETLSWLLRGLSEKEISAEMGLAVRTVHEYVVGVYRKIGVRSRPELMARWLEA